MIIYYTGRYSGVRAESRRLLEKAIGEYTGDAERAAQLVRDLKTGEHGKPYIEGFAHFSVSHTDGIWAVLFDERECGLDIQLAKDCDAAAVARRIYAPEDAEIVAAAAQSNTAAEGADHDSGISSGGFSAKGHPEAEMVFFRLWTRREALSKTMGGSVYDSGLPSVMNDHLVYDLRQYVICDIGIPGVTEVNGKKLFAAICIQETEDSGGYVPFFSELNDL